MYFKQKNLSSVETDDYVSLQMLIIELEEGEQTMRYKENDY